MPTTAPPSSVTTGGPNHALTLEAGTRLGEFEVTKTIGEGGFGIVYLAWDHSLDRKVALKEYMPTSLAYRAGATDIKPRSERHRETFDAGLKSFINEAKLLAQFDHPVAAQGLPLLGGERHRLHGHALPRGRDRARHRPGDAAARPARPGSSACWRRCSTRWRCCTRRRSTTATSRPTTCC